LHLIEDALELGIGLSAARLLGHRMIYSGAGRTILAKYIIARAQEGERDAKWLADSTVLYLSQQRLSQTPPDDLW